MPAILKRTGRSADRCPMFSPRKRPLLLVADRLLSLRPSLNTPVVATSELPAGPARAAIAVHVEAGARPRFVVAVRSLRDGASVVYELEEEDLNGESGHAVALDAALSFGESMGFLFDDEMIVDRSPANLRGALARLHELVAPPEHDVAEGAPPEAAAPESEILLEEPIEASPPRRPLAEAPVAETAATSSVPLTKFRTAPPAEPVRTSAGKGGALLGRVRPLRLRGGEAPTPVPPLLRLLSAF
jgi:hypothetical protein